MNIPSLQKLTFCCFYFCIKSTSDDSRNKGNYERHKDILRKHSQNFYCFPLPFSFLLCPFCLWDHPPHIITVNKTLCQHELVYIQPPQTCFLVQTGSRQIGHSRQETKTCIFFLSKAQFRICHKIHNVFFNSKKGDDMLMFKNTEYRKL